MNDGKKLVIFGGFGIIFILLAWAFYYWNFIPCCDTYPPEMGSVGYLLGVLVGVFSSGVYVSLVWRKTK